MDTNQGHPPDQAEQPEPTALELAIAALGEGGQVILANRCGVTPQAVNQWVRKGRAPPERVIDIEAATGVSRHALRPDIFGPLPAAPSVQQVAAP